MQLTFKFLHVDRSESLIEFATQRIARVEKFELKPTEACFKISYQRHQVRVELGLRGPNLYLRAEATTDNFYEAIDQAVDKIQTQMSKRKCKVKKHKNHYRSKQGQIERISPELEMTFINPLRKSG